MKRQRADRGTTPARPHPCRLEERNPWISFGIGILILPPIDGVLFALAIILASGAALEVQLVTVVAYTSACCWSRNHPRQRRGGASEDSSGTCAVCTTGHMSTIRSSWPPS